MLLPIIAAPVPEAVAEDKEPKFTINTNPSSGNVIEGNPITFTVILNNANDILPDGEELEVKCKTRNESAYINETKDKDYVEKNDSICHTFEGPVRGRNNFSVSITTNRDTFYEPTEEFTLEVTAEGTTVTKTVKIIDNNRKPTLKITPERVLEGSTVTLTFTLSGGDDLDYPITYDYRFPADRTVTTTTGYGGATMADVESHGSAIKINAGESTASSTFNTVDDMIPEPNEKLDIKIGAIPTLGNYASNIASDITDGEFTITIMDNDMVEEMTDIPVYLAGKESGSSSKTQLRLNEGETAEVEAMLAAPASEKIIIPITAKSISEPGYTNDFMISNQITIPAGDTSGSTELTIVNDSANDSSRYEALLIELGNMPEGFKKGDRSKLAVRMRDNDRLGASLRPSKSITISEKNGEATFEVHLDRPLAMRPSGAGTEFQGMLLEEGQASKVILEYSPKASKGARKNEDFTTSSDTFDLINCEKRQTCTVTVKAINDNYYEGDEGVDISISRSSTHEGTGINIPNDPLSLLITDDDMVPSVKLSVDADTGTDSVQNSLAEGGGEKMVRVTATLEGGSVFLENKTVTVEVGAGTSSAMKNTDYTIVGTQSIEINAKAESGYMDFTVTPVDDDLDEPDETIDVTGTLSGITATPATVTLTDNDDPVSFSIADAEATEGGKVTFTVTRAGAEGNVASVKVATEADSGEGVNAAGTDDYTAIATAQTLNFADGVTSQTVEIQTTQDDLFEPDETFRAVLSDPVLAEDDPGTGVSIETGKGTATGTIKNDDTKPSFAVADASASEGDAITFTVTRSGAMDNAVSVKWNTKAATGAGAASTSDYTEATTATKLDFAKGEDTQTFSVATTEDSLHEGNETFLVELTGAVGGTISDAEATGTITDDDAAPSGITLSVDTNGAEDGTPSTVAEDAGATVVTVTATVNGETRYVDAKTVVVSVDDGTAASPADYAAVNNFNITIAAGAASHTGSFTVTPVDDDLDESDETIDVTGTVSGVTITDATVTLTDTDAPVSFSIADADATEGGKVTFTVSRGGAEDNVASVKIATAADSGEGVKAAGTDDYTAIAAAQTLNFAAGVTSQTVEVQTTQDDLFEPDETFKAVLSDPVLAEDDPGTGVTIETGKGTATGTIKNDDTEPSFAVADASASEGNAITFTVTRSGAMDNAVSVKWNTKAATGDDAASASDYTAMTTATKLDFAKGVSMQTFTVATTPDNLHEGDETFLVVLTEPVDATISDNEATGTITNDDAEPSGITLSVSPDTVGEEDGETEITVTATVNGETRYVDAKTVTVSVGGGTAISGTDYTAVENFDITIAAGDASKAGTFDLTPTNEDLYEGNETIEVTGTSDSITVTNSTITLEDNDTEPSFAVADASASEGNAITFTVTRSGAMDNAVSVKWNTKAATGDDAASASDYTAMTTETKLDFAKGVSMQTFTVATTPDNLHEGDETFLVVLTEPVDATISDNEATGTITNDDAEPSGITLSVSPDTVGEEDGETEITVTATVNGETRYVDAKTVTVSVGGGTAISGTDYTAVENFDITIAAGDASKAGTFDLTPTNEDLYEGNETIEVTGTSDSITVTNSTITLEDNDTEPSFAVADASASEGNAITFTVTRSGAMDNAVSVKWNTKAATGDDAASASDYTAMTTETKLDFAKGVSMQTFTVATTPDNLHEGDETFLVVLTEPVDATISDNEATGTITNDDAEPSGITLSVSPDTVGEEDGETEITVTATVNGETRYVDAKTVTVSVGGGTAISGTDYTAVENFDITIAAGDASKAGTFDLTPTNEDLYEGNETIEVTGTSDSITVTNSTITLEDNDTEPSFAVADASASEGDAITFTVTRSGAMDNVVSVKWNTKADSGDDAASTSDYTEETTATKLDFAKGVPTQTFTVATTEDTLNEANETFLVELTEPVGGMITTAQATGTITNDDAAPTTLTLAVDADNNTENIQSSLAEDGGAKTVKVTATLGGSTQFDADKTLTLIVGDDDDSATEGTDYTTVPNITLTIPAGDQNVEHTFTLTPTDDAFREDNETISFDATLASVTVTGASITLTSEDAAPAITLTVDADKDTDNVQTSLAEDGGVKTVRVTATLDGTTRLEKAADLTLAVGKNSDSAVEGTDYTTVDDQTITIGAGVASVTHDFTLTPTNDDLYEGSETISLDGTLAGVTVTDTSLTLTDDDAAPSGITLSVSPATVGEEDGETEITVTATVNGSTRYVDAKTVTVSVGGGTATSATDYDAVANFDIIIAAGEASKSGTFDLTPTNDVLDEVNETINVTGTSGSLTITPATITITDNDDAPSGITLSVSPTTVGEGAGETEITVTATVNGSTRYVDAKTVTVSVGGGTAISGTDYDAVANFDITIAAGEASKTGTFDLTPTNDVLDEANETIDITGTSGDLTITPATITITDNDDAPSGITLSVSQAAVGEEDGETKITVTATVNGSTRYVDAKTVTVSVGGGTAISGTDYDAVANFDITIAAGEASKTGTFDLTPTNDVLDEANETIDITGTSGDLTITPATITITDNDDAPSGITLSVSQAAVGEEDGETKITVTATVNGSTRYVDAKTVTVSVGGGTAISGTDYDAVANFDITIAAGEASKTGTFDLTPTNDVLDEANETINVTGTSGDLTITPATITITDNDDAPSGITLSVSPTAVGEEDGETKITVTATVNGSTRYVDAKTVTVSVGGGTAISGTDYDAVANFDITIAAGEASKTGTFDLTPTNDVLDEANETIDITGTSGDLTITPATITITDNDDAPSGITLSVSPTAVGEEDGETKITVTATVNGSTRYVDAKTVTVSVGGGTAISGTDYDAVANFDITIAAGEASKTGTFDLTPTNDVLDEANETINVTGTSGDLTITPATITITDNDDAPSGITLSVSPTAVGEEDGETKITVTATVNGSTRYVDAKTVTVSVGGGTAISGTDYDAVANFDITIAAGEASKTGTFDLTPTNDVLDEANETIDITGTSGSLTITPATVTITDNDDAPSGITLSVSPTAVGEEDGETKITVTATVNGSTRYVDAKTVTVSVGGGTAISGTDYDAVANFDITIAAGEASKTGTFDLTPTNDVLDEANETTNVTGTSGSLTITPATITITDNDDAPSGITLSVSPTAVGEEDGETKITVTATV